VHAHNFKDLTGLKFGKRVVVSFNSVSVYNGKRGSSLWNVLCDCGKESVVLAGALKKSKSCGCDESYAIRSGTTRKSTTPEKVRANHGHRKRTFGLSPEDFEKMKQNQGDRCAICSSVFSSTPHIDHNHACCTGKKSCGKCIRGLLCHHCNAGLGNFRDDIQRLDKAIQYLGRKTP
jgi:hypothetical protein